MSEPKTFEQTIIEAARDSLVKLFRDGAFLQPDYANRIKVPVDLVTKVYELIDYEEILSNLRPTINAMIADRIASSISNEVSTDVKRILAHEPTRLRLRAAVIAELDHVGAQP